jgi:hypothetical protein
MSYRFIDQGLHKHTLRFGWKCQGLSEWAAKATFPAHDFTAGTHSVNGENVKKVIMELKKAGSETLTSDMVVHRFPVQQAMFRSLQSTVDSKARSTMKMLNKNVPLRRFIAAPDTGATNAAGQMGESSSAREFRRTQTWSPQSTRSLCPNLARTPSLIVTCFS